MNDSRIILVTGGSRSGKSEFAEKLLENMDDVLYIATAIITDDEMKDRIQKHRDRRNNLWTTYEGYKDLGSIVLKDNNKYIMLDCVTIMVTNLMFENLQDFDSISDKQIDALICKIKSEFRQLLDASRQRGRMLVMVTNEVGSGIVPENRVSRIFRDIAGIINQYIASLSDEVYIVACGLPLKLK